MMQTEIKKDAECTTRPATLYQKPRYDFTLIVEGVKAGFVKLAVWVSIAIGA